MATGNHTISLAGGTELPQTRRFNRLWKWYQTGLGGVAAINCTMT
jgi:hypothetical protein